MIKNVRILTHVGKQNNKVYYSLSAMENCAFEISPSSIPNTQLLFNFFFNEHQESNDIHISMIN